MFFSISSECISLEYDIVTEITRNKLARIRRVSSSIQIIISKRSEVIAFLLIILALICTNRFSYKVNNKYVFRNQCNQSVSRIPVCKTRINLINSKMNRTNINIIKYGMLLLSKASNNNMDVSISPFFS